MKESVLDVLMYLFEAFVDADADPEPDRGLLRGELERAGFNEPQIGRAFDWLDDLNELGETGSPAPNERATRIYTESEAARLGVDSRGYLLHLEQNGILSAQQRELILERLMALGDAEIDVERLKWIVLIVLFSQDDEHAAYARMENLVFEEQGSAIH